MADELRQERVRMCNRFREQLRRYFPQALGLSRDVGADWFLDLWERVPTPQKAKRARAAAVHKILKAHRIRKISADEALSMLRQPAVTVAPGTAEAATAHLRMLLPRLRLLNQQIRQCHRKLESLLDRFANQGSSSEDDEGQTVEQRDATILRSIPGVGTVVLATLLAEASQPLQRRDYHTLRALCGVAPVTRQSGKRRLVLMRHACHPRLRDALYHWARVASQCDRASRERYAALRHRGHSHGRALRTIGDRLLYVACVLLNKRSCYDPGYGRTPCEEAAA